MVVAQFKTTGAETDEIAINDLVKLTNVTPGTFSTRTTAAPHIQVWNGTGYTHYFYISDATGGEASGCWARTKAKATEKISLGKGFWFSAPSVEDGAVATFAGEVKSDANTKEIAIGNTEFVIVGNPFPVDLTFEKMTTKGLIPGTFSTRTTTAPHMQVWNGTGYTHYFYISDATGGSASGSWARTKAAATGVFAKVGEGFWIQSASEGSITISLD